MLRQNSKSRLDVGELLRRARRLLDGNVLSYRRLFLLMLAVCMFFYMLPPIYRYLFRNEAENKDPLMQCMDDRLTPFVLQNFEYDANIRHVPPLQAEHDFLPYVGNGYIGLEIAQDALLNIKSERAMNLQVNFQPLVSVKPTKDTPAREATVVEYLSGIVHRFQCFPSYFVSYDYYAHRTHSSILMQEIKITNSQSNAAEVELQLPRMQLQAQTQRKLQLGAIASMKDFEIISGTVLPKQDNKQQLIVVSIVQPTMERLLQLKKRSSLTLEVPIAVHYSKPITEQQLKTTIEEIESKAVQAMSKVLLHLQNKSSSSGDAAKINSVAYKREHMHVWSELWATGFSISTSKAERSLNGERINATMYAVLSQVRSYEHEEFLPMSAPRRQEMAKTLSYAEGCYDSYHTLQANNLWLDLNTLEKLNQLVASWMLTLEKQGCHNLIRAGASGVMQAMVLSFGSFRFSNQHLECNMHPKFLHRDFHFRRLNYGNKTHVNVTISVTEENKAIINVALDRSDRSYYACDAGCPDEPVLLTQGPRIFPVKLTEPLTAILYITEDKQHMTELHAAIHVKEVVEAPAHEQHIIALHRHGHQLGGLPTLFWVSVCAVIVVFHIFLCKLIIKEYCEPSDKLRYRYNKP